MALEGEARVAARASPALAARAPGCPRTHRQVPPRALALLVPVRHLQLHQLATCQLVPFICASPVLGLLLGRGLCLCCSAGSWAGGPQGPCRGLAASGPRVLAGQASAGVCWAPEPGGLAAGAEAWDSLRPRGDAWGPASRSGARHGQRGEWPPPLSPPVPPEATCWPGGARKRTGEQQGPPQCHRVALGWPWARKPERSPRGGMPGDLPPLLLGPWHLWLFPVSVTLETCRWPLWFSRRPLPRPLQRPPEVSPWFVVLGPSLPFPHTEEAGEDARAPNPERTSAQLIRPEVPRRGCGHCQGYRERHSRLAHFLSLSARGSLWDSPQEGPGPGKHPLGSGTEASGRGQLRREDS